MSNSGYYRYPTLYDDQVVFVCEDDLWTVAVSGGIARRLTSNLGEVDSPAFSPDGQWLAFTGREEGAAEVFVMPALGGPARRLTFLGADACVVGWTPDGASIVFSSSHASPFVETMLYTVSPAGGEPSLLPVGVATSIAFGSTGGRVIARHVTDLAAWKRYRGGRTGDLWLDARGDGQWRRLCGDENGERLAGNVARPLWIGNRIYFLSDQDGVGNLYSVPVETDEPVPCSPQRHTFNSDYYLRHTSTDGRHIVYSAGGDLYWFDPAADRAPQRINIQLHSPRVQCNRKFVDPARHLQHYALHPEGAGVALTTRGQVFAMANWEGAVVAVGPTTTTVDDTLVAVHQRLATWLHDGERLLLVNDADGEDALEIYRVDGTEPPQRLAGLDVGRPQELWASPTRDQAALTNHRNELQVVDLAQRRVHVVERSLYGGLRGVAWSPDGHWLAYAMPLSEQISIIKLYEVDTGAIHEATRPVLRDEEPAWDPEGRYLYFLSGRDFDPVYDNLQFDLNFPRGVRPYLITLQKDLPSPFVPVPRAPGERKHKKDAHERLETPDESADENAELPAASEDAPTADTPISEETAAQPADEERITIDLDGIADRILAFPVEDARYDQIRGIEGKVLFSWWPIEGALHSGRRSNATPGASGLLDVYDLGDQKVDTILDGLTSFEVSMDGKTLIYRMGNKLRVLNAGDKPDSKGGGAPGRQNGWLDLNRLKVSVSPGVEWAQMYRHGWRLQRDQFWTADMSGIDWQQVYHRYWPLVSRVASRSEFSDLMWEMQGELGTSHAYEIGGDYKPEPDFAQGYLGADFVYDATTDGYRVERILRGDPWDEKADSPLHSLGLNISVGAVLLAVGGRRLSRSFTPQQALVNLAGERVFLTFLGDGDEPHFTVTVKTLRSEWPLRYRAWVEGNRRRVHEATAGRIGYLHIPDMGPSGYGEFFRSFLSEVNRQGLVVDVRYNGGGHVSQLLLERLSRRRIGYDVQRWGAPEAYPAYTVPGPLVALTNEWAGSDGDIFSHAFKLLKLGPLIGTRTWGGVIGISPQDTLIDGGVTTQPEFSFWFEDVGWGVENYGTEPDIKVEITPEDWVVGRDPQLERGIAEALRLLDENPPTLPDFSVRPRLGMPTLPTNQQP
ncbi:MAG: S41 family peptidase [Anaerolineae bacterium]